MTCKAAVDMVAAVEVVDTEVSLRLRPGLRTARIYLASQLLLNFAWVAALIIIDLGWDL